MASARARPRNRQGILLGLQTGLDPIVLRLSLHYFHVNVVPLVHMCNESEQD